MQKPDRMTVDTVILYDLMLTLSAKLSIYEKETAETAVSWFEQECIHGDLPETGKAMRRLLEATILDENATRPIVWKNLK